MPAPADVRLILAGRLSDHIERQSVARKAEFAVGAQRILADPQIARVHLDRCFQVLRKSAPSSDFEWNKERLAIAHQDDPLP